MELNSRYFFPVIRNQLHTKTEETVVSWVFFQDIWGDKIEANLLHMPQISTVKYMLQSGFHTAKKENHFVKHDDSLRDQILQ